MKQIGAHLLLEHLVDRLEALVLCKACETLATLVEMELVGPQSLHLQAPNCCLELAEVWLVYPMGDQPTSHPVQLASMDDQC